MTNLRISPDLAFPPEAVTRSFGILGMRGSFQTYLATLRRNGLVDVDGVGVRASDTLFLEPTHA